MPRYEVNPRECTAWKILDSRVENGVTEVACEGLEGWNPLPDGATARYMPVAGDYVVQQDDGYIYVNPASVFERNWRLKGSVPEGKSTTGPPLVSSTGSTDATVKVQGAEVGAQAGDVGPKSPSTGPSSTGSPTSTGTSTGPDSEPPKAISA